MALNVSYPSRRCVVFRRQKNDEVIPQEAAGLQDQGAALLDVREDDDGTAGTVA